MPRRSFGAARRSAAAEPIVFTLGPFLEEFTVVPEPSLGDTFDVFDAPEPSPSNMLESARLLARFIRRMLAPEDRPRFDQTLYRMQPANEAAVAIVECAMWITEQVTGFPTVPPADSSDGRHTNGTTSSSGTDTSPSS